MPLMHLDAVHLYSLTNQERSRLLEMPADRCCDVFSLPGACRQCAEETPLHVEYLQRFAWTEHFLSACSEIAQRYRRRISRGILFARIRFHERVIRIVYDDLERYGAFAARGVHEGT